MIADHDLLTRPARPEDDAALRQLIAVPMTTRGIMLSFQREPSYFAASQVIYKVNDHGVVEDPQTHDILGVYSNGYRPCYINGFKQDVRYACDLRIKRHARGRSILVNYIGPHFCQNMVNPNFSQVIIFNDNHVARAAVQSSKMGMPRYHDDCIIETLTLTGFKSRTKREAFIQQQLQRTQTAAIDPAQLTVRVATVQDIPAMNAFIVEMTQYYNYVLAYDFNELAAGDAYFKNLNLDDFQLYWLGDKLVGMFGLWHQCGFKQSKIVDYGKLIALARPFYNIWARLTGAMVLPKRGESFQYHALHSLLCHPQQLDLHDQMLRDAYALSAQAGVASVSYTLAHQDPRQALNAFYKGELLVGMHGFLCNDGNPLDYIDRSLIPFLEVGRI